MRSFEEKKKKRRTILDELRKKTEEGIISLNTSRKIKQKIRKDEIKLDVVRDIIKDEAKKTQEKLRTFVGEKEGKKEEGSKNIVLSTKEYKTPLSVEGYNLYYKRCEAEEADFVVVRYKNKKVRKYLDKDRTYMEDLKEYFEKQD